ncbi:TetR family transcriptional regulator [Paludibaculum fermentans]|uniref:TetR family transcriptional regulator n=1 Tax=Paludibaculum fermentans TaxID=1473598 RepID=A0A7S7NNA3_PALFE|nr:TetR family transcriptional regulator [Paludibaculum fermentans]QOY86773.1 TetR family transcriptional regulator [Paludibaculum fermentans]
MSLQHLNEVIPDAPDALPTLQLRKQQFVRDAIWDAAIDLFAEKGFDETTVDDIARAAGVSRRSFFRYFASKNDLMAHAMLSYGTILTAAIDSCPPGFTLREVLQATVLEVVKASAAHPRTPKIMAILAEHPGAQAAEMSRLPEVQHQVGEAFARRCRLCGEDGLAASLLAGLTLQVAGVAVRCWYEQGQGDIPQTVDLVLGKLNHLLCTEPDSGTRRPAKSGAPARTRK